MPIIRDEFAFRRSSEIASQTIDIEAYDRCGRFTTDSQVALCGSGENPLFIFAESASEDEPVSVVWRAKGGRVSLKLSGSGDKGDKLQSDASGKLIASATGESAVPAAGDFAIALESWSDGQETEVEILA